MSYKIGQTVVAQSNNKNTSISNIKISGGIPSRCSLTDESGYFDECLILTDNNIFKKDTYYYVHCKIKKFNISNQNFQIKLINSDRGAPNKDDKGALWISRNESGYQFVSSITIPSASSEGIDRKKAQEVFEEIYNNKFLPALNKVENTEQRVELINTYLEMDNTGSPTGELIKAYYAMKIDTSLVNEWQDIELIFKPATDYNTLLFQLSRTPGEDLRYPVILYEEVSILENQIKNNLIYSKIGIQSHPGLMTCINGEKIIIGRTGIYEIKNGVISVNFFAAPKAGKLEGEVYANKGFIYTRDNKSNIIETELKTEYNSLSVLLDEMALKAQDSLDDDSKLQECNVISRSLITGENNYKYTTDAYILDYMYNEESGQAAALNEEA